MDIRVLTAQPGQVFYHKATRKRVVVLKQNQDGTVKVRTVDDEERDYDPSELEVSKLGAVARGKRTLY